MTEQQKHSEDNSHEASKFKFKAPHGSVTHSMNQMRDAAEEGAKAAGYLAIKLKRPLGHAVPRIGQDPKAQLGDNSALIETSDTLQKAFRTGMQEAVNERQTK